MKPKYPGGIIHQYVYETEEWGRLLAFLKQETVFYKSRLAEVVNNIRDDQVLLAAEKFNDEFISQDRITEFLLSELHRQNKLLEKDLHLDGGLLGEAIRNQKKLRSDVKKAEEIFAKTKSDFAGYLDGLY